MTRSITVLFLAFFSLIFTSAAMGQNTQLSNAKQKMLDATKFMVEKVSTNGGYVGLYLEDLSRRWGELEAYKTMIWVQNPGTVDMGHVFLDAYKVTKDEYYYKAAEKVAGALIFGQQDSGGWNYMIDFAGDASNRNWYNTIGKNAWGFEEHNHYYGNATFDDEVTSQAARFLLRMYLEKLDVSFKPSLDKAINFIIQAQYPLGGWPQRYPLKHDYPHGDYEDYTSFYTYNDDVILGNLNFLIDCYVTLGEKRFLDPIQRAMNFFIISQQGNPQAGWGQQYDMDLKPAHARSYEPPALLPGQTFRNSMSLISFYEYTGDRKFIARIPDAIKWLESIQLPKSETADGRYTHPVFAEIGSNKQLYAHRTGTGVNNGRYWWDYNSENPLLHYGAKTKLNMDQLKDEYARVNALSPEEVTRNSPIKNRMFTGGELPQRYFDGRINPPAATPDESAVKAVIAKLDNQNRWLTRHEWASRPYSVTAGGEESNTARDSDAGGRAIMDASDQQYISLREYMKNMNVLINYVRQPQQRN
ncbi:MAG: pectate lyase [Daejeonella sp.]